MSDLTALIARAQQLEVEARKALTCLHIAVESSVADDVTAKVVAVFDALKAALEAQAAQIQQMTAERDQFAQLVDDYQNREAACCPEDVGFEEVIASLRKKLTEAEARLAALEGRQHEEKNDQGSCLSPKSL